MVFYLDVKKQHIIKNTGFFDRIMYNINRSTEDFLNIMFFPLAKVFLVDEII